jgi:hypothetical protein
MRKRPWPNYSSLKLDTLRSSFGLTSLGCQAFFVTVVIVPSNLDVRMHGDVRMDVPQVRPSVGPTWDRCDWITGMGVDSVSVVWTFLYPG